MSRSFPSPGGPRAGPPRDPPRSRHRSQPKVLAATQQSPSGHGHLPGTWIGDTHILKRDRDSYPGMVVSEFLCAQALKNARLPVAFEDVPPGVLMGGKGSWWNQATLVSFGRYCGLSAKETEGHIEDVCSEVEATLPQIDTARGQHKHFNEVGERMAVLWKHALEEIRAKRAKPKPIIKYPKCKRKRLKTMGATSQACSFPRNAAGGTGTTRLEGVKSLRSDEPDDTEAVPDSEAQFLSTT